jgi:hypothetical protein
VANLRAPNVTPHVVQNDSITATGKRRQSAIGQLRLPLLRSPFGP